VPRTVPIPGSIPLPPSSFRQESTRTVTQLSVDGPWSWAGTGQVPPIKTYEGLPSLQFVFPRWGAYHHRLTSRSSRFSSGIWTLNLSVLKYISDLIWYEMIYYIWYDILRYDTIYDIWNDTIYNMIWYDIWYDMIG
jgi:hypothetical protein